MPTLTTIEKAPILNEAAVHLSTSMATVVSSDPAVVSINTTSSKFFANGVTPGQATVTATRIADGSQASVLVEVVVPATPFAITLGTPVAK